MFNALNGLGGAGLLSPQTASESNTAVYLSFFISSFVGCGVINLCGVRYPSALACLTYALHTGSYIVYRHTYNGAFPVAAGAMMGMGAGVLWTSQGVVMVSYPRENQKGLFMAVFNVIFNAGGLVGAVVPFALDFYSKGLSDSVYIIIAGLQCMGALAALCLAAPGLVVRNDGSHATILQRNSAAQEILEVLRLFKNRWMLLLVPMYYTSNAYLAYQFIHFNGALFTLRTRAFNNILYWSSQIIGSLVLSALLDFSRWTRKTRGLSAVAAIFLTFNAVWACALLLQIRFTRGGSNTDYPGGQIDFLETPRAAGPIFLYFAMGVVDSWYQNMAYWIIGTLTSDSYITARYVGFYKGIQSLGAAISWQISAQNAGYMDQLIGNWILFGLSLPTVIYTVMHIKDRALDDQLVYLSPKGNMSNLISDSEMDLSLNTAMMTPRLPPARRYLGQII
ncbi:hypothetical protein GGF46_005337 [Coemansia sp. RSA 552]|nr:hypothetical protein GGF46_005337 [Coemansia sp. RSA 552]